LVDSLAITALFALAYLFIFSNAIRAFTLSGRMKPEDAVVATLSSLPDEVVDTVGTVLPSEDSVSERRRKLEFLEMQEELIKVCTHQLDGLLYRVTIDIEII
jgi:hypothetical protein